MASSFSAFGLFVFHLFDAFSESIRSRPREGSSYFRLGDGGWGGVGGICGQEARALLLLGWPQKYK